MDDQVKAALAKWPDVPDCTGWLALDTRGRWRVGETKDGTRQPINHPAMNAFINRNYAAHGRYWIFQNGPQRVFVELAYTPFVWRLVPREDREWDLVAHTGDAMTPTSAWLDDEGRFLFEARPVSRDAGEPVVGVVHDHDTALVAELLRDEQGAPLDDATLSSISTAQATDFTAMELRARLRWRSDASLELPLQRIAAHQVPLRFDFEPAPAVGLRVDVDTRR
jgi:hypothetical protein